MNRSYWMRVVAAFMLLKFASAIMKDAERLLSKTYETPEGVKEADADG